jgi:hypothetical protein
VNCADGGWLVHAGTDDGTGAGTPDDGILHEDERDESFFVCHGEDGATGAQGPQGEQGLQGDAGADGDDGFNALVKSTAEPPGGNCAAGGHFVEAGTDNGDGAGTAGDNVLQAGEVDVSEYVCHGEEGEEGPTGPGGPAGEDGFGNLTVNSLVGILPSMTHEQSAAVVLFLVFLVLAFFQRWLFVAIAAVIGILEIMLVDDVFGENGFIFTALLLVLALILQVLVDMRDAEAPVSETET